MARKPFTEEQQNFIRDNRLTMSINAMCVETGLGYTRVYNFMAKNNLILTKEEKQNRKLRPKKTEKKADTWVSEPWKYGLNLITMAR